MIPIWIKLFISLIWDLLDFTIGRIPAFGTLFDIGGTLLAILLYGGIGTVAIWEVFDITDQLDAEIPTLTIIGILSYIGGKRT